jgi:spermidine synthase
MKDDQYVMETAPDGAYRFGFGRKEKIFEKQSPFQKVEIFETSHHGRVLLHDGFFMISDRDEAIYHEMIAHVPLFTHTRPQDILIIGGGDGGTAREVLRHPGVERCVMVEIDEVVVEACREYFPQVTRGLKDPRLELLIEDGVKYLKECEEKFDVIIIDSTDPIGPATPLFGEEFYADVRRCLKADGIVVAQGESPFYDKGMQEKLISMNVGHFKYAGFYNFSNLTYPGGLWSFFFASRKNHPVLDLDVEREEGLEKEPGLNGSFQYYNADVHRASFSLPQFQRQRLSEWITI